MFKQFFPVISFVRAVSRIRENVFGGRETQDEIILEVRLDAIRFEQQDALAA